MKSKLLLVVQLLLLALIEIFFIWKIIEKFPFVVIITSGFVIIFVNIFIYWVIQDNKRKETFKEYY